MGTAGAKAFGDALLVNKTIQHLNVSGNSFGMPMVGDQVKLKSSGEMCEVFISDEKGIGLIVDGKEDQHYREDSEWEWQSQWQSQISAFCSVLAASTSLLSSTAAR